MAPLGGPVLPLVKRMAAISLRRVSAAVNVDCAERRSSSSGIPPQIRPPPTVTRILIVSFPQPSSRRAKCALGMPMKASGSASARQPFMFFAPMPGSMKTGTAPALKRAKVRANSSGDGGTSNATRVPRVMPTLSSPAAIQSLSWSSSRKERLRFSWGKMIAAVSGWTPAISVSGREMLTMSVGFILIPESESSHCGGIVSYIRCFIGIYVRNFQGFL